MKTIRYIVHGRVQGVGFRNFVYHCAKKLPVSGYVRNLPNGSVECVAKTDDATHRSLLADLRRGPTLSRVDEISQEPSADRVPDGFEIRY